jgi:MAGE family
MRACLEQALHAHNGSPHNRKNSAIVSPSDVSMTKMKMNRWHPKITRIMKMPVWMTLGGYVQCPLVSSEPPQVAQPQHEQDLKNRAADLVRLALFHEQRRMPLRRDEISKKVMGSQRGAFKAVFEEAQTILRGTFGMELVELATRAATHDSAGASRDKTQEKPGTQTQDGEEGAGDRQGITGLRKKGAVRRLPIQRLSDRTSMRIQLACLAVAQGSKTYILRSTLDPVLVERASQTNKRILEAEAADAPDDVDGAEPGMRTYGSLIAWNSADQLSALGILHVILALILVSGKVISDSTFLVLLQSLLFFSSPPPLHPRTPLSYAFSKYVEQV